MLISTKHEISTAYKTKMLIRNFLVLKLSYVVFILTINVKMPTIVGIDEQGKFHAQLLYMKKVLQPQGLVFHLIEHSPRSSMLDSGSLSNIC